MKLTSALIIAALSVATQASAVPFVGPIDDRVARNFVLATESNDLVAYADLFAADATITVGNGEALPKAKWIEVVRDDFAPARQTHFLAVIGKNPLDGNRGAQVIFVVKQQHCLPQFAGCYPTIRIETIKVLSGKIVELHRSDDFSHELTPNGAWSYYFKDETR